MYTSPAGIHCDSVALIIAAATQKRREKERASRGVTLRNKGIIIAPVMICLQGAEDWEGLQMRCSR